MSAFHLQGQTIYSGTVLDVLDPAGNGSITRVTTDSDNYLSNTAFQSELDTAVAAGMGGVLFTGAGSNQGDVGGLTGAYGLTDEKSLSLSLSASTQTFFATIGQLSTSRPFGLATGTTRTFTLTPASGEQISQLAFTLDNRTATSAGTFSLPTITVNFGDTSSVVLTDSIADGAVNTDNVFFSIDGSANGGIASFSVQSAGARGFGVDGIGFITTVVPEPGSALLFATGMLAIGLRRRRRS